MAEPGQERTEAATPRRRQRAREEGQVAKSREVISTSLFLGNLLFFTFAGTALARQLLLLMQGSFVALGTPIETVAGTYALLLQYLWRLAAMLLPFFLVTLVVAVGSHIVQTGFLWAPKALLPQPSFLNLWQGLGRLFSMQALMELGKSVAKTVIVGVVAYTSIRHEAARLASLSYLEPLALSGAVGGSLLRLGRRTAIPLVILAILDYLWQRWEYEKRLRMTVQEVKEERKEDEGDPQVKVRIRSIMREMARKRMMEEVPKADVVVTNPTHLAVALRYDHRTMPAPQVVAKGAGYIAERIKMIAREHAIPLVENRAVAQSLYKSVEVGHFIPVSLYRAVAEILAYVYQLKQQGFERRP